MALYPDIKTEQRLRDYIIKNGYAHGALTTEVSLAINYYLDFKEKNDDR